MVGSVYPKYFVLDSETLAKREKIYLDKLRAEIEDLLVKAEYNKMVKQIDSESQYNMPLRMKFVRILWNMKS